MRAAKCCLGSSNEFNLQQDELLYENDANSVAEQHALHHLAGASQLPMQRCQVWMPRITHLNNGEVWMNCPSNAGNCCSCEKTGAETDKPSRVQKPDVVNGVKGLAMPSSLMSPNMFGYCTHAVLLCKHLMHRRLRECAERGHTSMHGADMGGG